MKITNIKIKKFKNFKDFEINFTKDNYEVIIGENGTGKSNLFEVIIEIFLFLLEDKKDSPFDFEISYEINNNKVKVISEKNKVIYKLDETEEEKVGKPLKKFLPETLMLYYSGKNERINNYLSKYEEQYRGKNRKTITKKNKEIRNIFGILKEHKSILLLLLFIYKNNKKFNQILKDINIKEDFFKGKLILKTPFYGKKEKIESMSIYDEKRFWGIGKDILEKLNELAKGNLSNASDGNEGFFYEEQKFYITLNKEILEEMANKYSIYEMFSFFDDLRVIEMLDRLELSIEKDQESFSDFNLSEGENQYIIFNTIIELFEEKECIFLLDEPDSYLHPKWQDRLIEALQSKENSKNQILLTTHNVTTIARCSKNPFLLQKNKNPKKIGIDYAVGELSSHLAELKRNNNINIILEAYKIEDQPMVLTEGKTDCNIIKKAWRVLKKSEPPFKLIPVFGDEFLQRTLVSNDIKNLCKEKPIIGIFDFDEAYNYWNKLFSEKYVEIEKDPYKCLVKKDENKNIYGMLLPVNPNKDTEGLIIKNKENKTTFKQESKFSIELLFYGFEETKKYFKEELCVGGKRMAFNWNKNKFSTEEISKFSEESFKNFIPLVNKIEEILR